MSKALINFLIGLAWLVLYITVIANWVREMGLIIPASIASWLMLGSIPVFIGIAMYVFDKKFYKKESLIWKAIYTGFVVWLIVLVIVHFIQIDMPYIATTPLGYAFMIMLSIMFKKYG